jgi:YVTN family beta-propeller protein
MKRSIKNASIAGGSAVVLAAAAIAAVALSHPGVHPASAAGTANSAISKSTEAKLLDSTCTGPAGAAYVADAGYDAFSAINTANCQIVGKDYEYNVGDPYTPGYPSDQSYSGDDEAIAAHGDTLYFADTGDSQVAVINAAGINPETENQTETDINVGLFPSALAVSPDGSQLWVADTGPQTSASSPSGIDIIDTATNTVTAKLPLSGQPSKVAFAPDGSQAYVVTNDGLVTYSVATRRVVGFTSGIGLAHGIAVSPDGTTLYVTDTTGRSVKVIDARTGRVTDSIGVGDTPWDDVISSNGSTLYVANMNSDSVSVISTATDKVTDTISITGDPDTLALTPDGSQLWVAQQTLAYVDVIDTSDNSLVSDFNLAGPGPASDPTKYNNYDDGFEPDGIVLVSTPTPGS